MLLGVIVFWDNRNHKFCVEVMGEEGEKWEAINKGRRHDRIGVEVYSWVKSSNNIKQWHMIPLHNKIHGIPL